VTELPIIPLTHLDLRFEPAPWPFADERRAEIDAHFAKLRAEKPQMWNGRVLLLRRGEIAEGVLSGAYSEVDFASFIAWRDWDFPDRSVRNCFPMAALRSSDGAFLLGVMGAHTATAGQIYFPAGTPDRQDLAGDTVDLERGAPLIWAILNGKREVGFSLFSLSANCFPVTPLGITMSVSNRAIRFDSRCHTFKASTALAAVRTRYPCDLSTS
jgi:hypothetical protein